jgi:hypothetical protein
VANNCECPKQCLQRFISSEQRNHAWNGDENRTRALNLGSSSRLFSCEENDLIRTVRHSWNSSIVTQMPINYDE